MKSPRSKIVRLLCYSLPLLAIVSVGVMLLMRHQVNQFDANMDIPSITEFGRDTRSLKYQDRQVRRSAVALSSVDYPIYRLPERLRRIVSDFETRSLFMESPFGFKNEELWAAMEDCRGIIDELTANDVVSLIEYYRDPVTRKLPTNGHELVGPMLYEHWGKIQGERAAAWIDSQIETSIERSSDSVDLTDPFGMDPGVSDVLSVFTGWASVDASNALSAWEQIHANLGLTGSSVLNLADLDDRVRSAISEVSQDKQN